MKTYKVIFLTIFNCCFLLIATSTLSFASGNGCGTGWNTQVVRDSYGGADFTDSCNAHDSCYEQCGKTKKECDKTFRKRMKDECRNTYTSAIHVVQKNACLKVVDGYYESVKKMGGDAWRDAQENCGDFHQPNCDGVANIELRPLNANLDFKRGTVWDTCTGYRVSFQNDGNLVVYNRSGNPVWASDTHNKSANILAMQTDGNLVIYTSNGTPIWASNTHGNPNAFLAVQQDGNVVIYRGDGHPIWSTNTYGK